MLGKSLYWISTVLLALFYIAGGIMYVVSTASVQADWAALGYPTYLVPLMAPVMIAGAVAILWRPVVALAELAYAGIFFHLLLAISAHINARDGEFGPALVALAVLLLSQTTQNAARSQASPFAAWPRAAA